MKNRDTVYFVERHAYQTNFNVVVAAFSSSELAQQHADRWNQEFKDRRLGDEFIFQVAASTYYDE